MCSTDDAGPPRLGPSANNPYASSPSGGVRMQYVTVIMFVDRSNGLHSFLAEYLCRRLLQTQSGYACSESALCGAAFTNSRNPSAPLVLVGSRGLEVEAEVEREGGGGDESDEKAAGSHDPDGARVLLSAGRRAKTAFSTPFQYAVMNAAYISYNIVRNFSALVFSRTEGHRSTIDSLTLLVLHAVGKHVADRPVQETPRQSLILHLVASLWERHVLTRDERPQSAARKV